MPLPFKMPLMQERDCPHLVMDADGQEVANCGGIENGWEERGATIADHLIFAANKTWCRDGDFIPLGTVSVTAIVPDPVAPRKAVLLKAIDAIMGDRNASYGPPTQDFERTAGLLSALFAGQITKPFAASDVARLMILLKLSRSMWSDKEDHWTDMAGYAGCGWECVVSK